MTARQPDTAEHIDPAGAAIVTGASSGIGRATAERLAHAGHPVVMGARRVEDCEMLAKQLREQGATAFAAPLDVADTRSIDRFVEQATNLVGPIDILVSNAGQSQPLAATSADSAALKTVFDVNVVGAQYLTALLTPSMVERGSGDLLFVSSEVVGKGPRPHMAAYSASKHALEAWVAVLEAELEGSGVRVSVVRPGHTLTEYASGWDSDDTLEMIEAWQHFGILRHLGMLAPGDVADVICSALSLPPHMQLRLIEVQPVAPKPQEEPH